MSAGKICTRIVASTAPSETVRAAARRMADHNVGTLVVLDDEKKPVGLLTDRDVVLRVVSWGRDAESVLVSDVMTTPAHTVHADTPIEEALVRMRGAAVRRLVVVDDDGEAAGVLSVDDVLELMTEEATVLGQLLRKEVPVL